MKTFIQFLKESTKSLQNAFPDVLRMMAQTGSSPAKISVHPTEKPGRKRKATKVIVYPPENIGLNNGQYIHSDDNTGSIQLSNTDDTNKRAVLGHELAHAVQAAGIVSDNNGEFPDNADRHDIPYSERPNEIHARSIQAALLGREQARDDLLDIFRNAKQGKSVPSIEYVKKQAKANYDDVLIDIGRTEDITNQKSLKRTKSRVLGGYEHGFRYAANPATLKSIRRKAEQIRRQRQAKRIRKQNP
jgi:hypothetical protein